MLSSGNYEVSMLYTCPEKSEGSTIELKIGEARLRSRITQAWDPPLIGADEDRVARTESYVKEFAVLEMGTISLTPGRFKLSLQASEVVGANVADFRLLMFKRK